MQRCRMCKGVFILERVGRVWLCVLAQQDEVLRGELGNGQQAANEYLAAGCHHEC